MLVEKRKKLLLEWLGIGTIVIAMVLVAFWGGTKLYESRQWDPLADYPIQVVRAPEREGEIPFDAGLTDTLVSRGNFAKTPVFYWDEEIANTGIKCVKEDELGENENGIVRIEGTIGWQSDQPPGRFVEVGKGSNTRGPGCQQYEFSNPVPDKVREEMMKLKEDGIELSVWHISGTETPVRGNDGDLEKGVPRQWRTTSFTVIHEDAP